MDIYSLGFTDELSEIAGKPEHAGLSPGRVTQVHRERYVVTDGEDEYEAEVTGVLRFTATGPESFPAVGDWVMMMKYDGTNAIIHSVLPRKSLLSRRAAGKKIEEQLIAANVDVLFIMQSLDSNFSINRLERYMAVSLAAGVEPVLLLSKADLSGEEQTREALKDLDRRHGNVKRLIISNLTHQGIGDLLGMIMPACTYCLAGSSGVGKTTLLNILMKAEVRKTAALSLSTGKGRHTTTRRELFVLGNGGIIIDTPGMKELGLTGETEGLAATFADINALAGGCRYADCTHVSEAGCAVLDALEKGTVDPEGYDNYLKMIKEQERFLISEAERRKKEKVFGKILKNYHRDIKKNSESGL